MFGGLRWPYDAAMKVDTARVLAEDKLARLARDSTDTVAFWKAASEVLDGTVPFDFHPCWFTVDPATLLLTGHLNEGLDRTPPEIAQAWYAEGDVNSPTELARVRGGAATVRSATGGDAVASWRWRNLLEPMGFDDSLDAVLRRGPDVWGALSLLHTPDSRPYTAADVRFVARLSGVLATGTQLGLVRGEASDDAESGPAVVIVGADLVATTATSNAEDRLGELPDVGRYRPDRLPLPVQVVVLRALRSEDGSASAVVRSVSGRWLRVHGSRLAGSGEVAVVVEPATPQQLAPVRLAAYGLTPREREVVDLVLAGRSTAGIADRLFISEYTVQDRLKSIFEKVGVRSRRELVAAIHRSDFGPLVEANDDRVRRGAPLRQWSPTSRRIS